MSSFFKDIQEIVDPKRELSEEQIVSLVEEKFTSTNSKSTKCSHCGVKLEENLCQNCADEFNSMLCAL